MRLVVSWIILTVALLSLPACVGSSTCSKKDFFCAGLITDTLGIDDHGMNQDSWAGLEDARADGLVDRIEYIESEDTRDYQKNIAYFTQNGYDVVVTSGSGLLAETLRAAKLDPDTVFIGINQSHEETLPNLISITFPEDQIGFAAGASAARISQTRMVGAVCETSDIDSMWRYCEGFRAGAKFVDKNIIVQVIYRDEGSSEKLFMDEVWGYDMAWKLIQRGADVIFAVGGVTGQGALRAASELKVNAIGAERDQGAALGQSGSSVLTSIYGNARLEVLNVMRTLEGGNTNRLTLDRIQYVPLDEKFPESYTNELDILLLSLWDGNVKTNVNDRKP